MPSAVGAVTRTSTPYGLSITVVSEFGTAFGHERKRPGPNALGDAICAARVATSRRSHPSSAGCEGFTTIAAPPGMSRVSTFVLRITTGHLPN